MSLGLFQFILFISLLFYFSQSTKGIIVLMKAIIFVVRIWVKCKPENCKNGFYDVFSRRFYWSIFVHPSCLFSFHYLSRFAFFIRSSLSYYFTSKSTSFSLTPLLGSILQSISFSVLIADSLPCLIHQDRSHRFNEKNPFFLQLWLFHIKNSLGKKSTFFSKKSTLFSLSMEKHKNNFGKNEMTIFLLKKKLVNCLKRCR